MKVDYDRLGDLLIYARLQSRMSAQKIAYLAGVSADCYYKYENNKHKGSIKLDNFVRICDVMGVDPADLIKKAEVLTNDC